MILVSDRHMKNVCVVFNSPSFHRQPPSPGSRVMTPPEKRCRVRPSCKSPKPRNTIEPSWKSNLAHVDLKNSLSLQDRLV